MKTGNKNGMNWIRPEKRLAIYLRDGVACVWCGSSLNLTLDHVRPRSRGGTNHEGNLVTACVSCNARRSSKISRRPCCTRRRLTRYLAHAKALIAAHGCFSSALKYVVEDKFGLIDFLTEV